MENSSPTDDEIIDAVLRGETNRYSELVDRYQLAVWKLSYSFVGNFEDAKEISQEGFFKGYRSLWRFRRKAKFSTWLYRIVANQCKDFLRHKSRQPLSAAPLPNSSDETDDSILFELADPSGDPSDALSHRELAESIGRCLQELPMKQRTAFILRHLNGVPIEEIARIMRCRPGTVKSHLFRAVEYLRMALNRHLSNGRTG